MAASFAARVALDAGVHGPWIFPDELGYQQAAVNLAHGRLAIYGKGGLSYSPLYPLTLSPLYALGLSASSAYEWLKAVNALLMSVALVPTYGIARFVLPRGAALAVAAVCATAPLMYYPTLGMSENLAYPVFLLAVWLLLRTIDRPTRVNDILFLAGVLVACAARIQLVVLLPAAVTAFLLQAVSTARSARRPLSSTAGEIARHHGAFVAGCVLLALAAALPGLTGHGFFSVAGRYSGVPATTSPFTLQLVKLAVYHVAGTVFVVGVVPFIGTLVAAYVWLRHGAGPRRSGFAAAGIGLVVWLLAETAFATQRIERGGDAPRIHERYLFYLLPLFVTALVAALRDRRARARPLVYVGAAAASAVMVLAIPFQTVINGTIVADSFSFQIFADNRTLQSISHATVLAVAVVAGLGLLLVLIRKYPVVVGVVVVLTFVYMSSRLAPRIQAAADGERAFVGHGLDWVDRAHPVTSVAMVVGPAVTDPVAEWQTDYHNLSIGRLYYACRLTLSPDFGERQISVGADGVVRVKNGGPVSTGYAVVPSGLGVEGTVLARDPVSRQSLVSTGNGPIRIRAAYRDRWTCRSS